MGIAELPLADTLARPLRDLRISVTDRCQFRCTYCMPREVFGRDFAFLPREQLLTFEELTRLARVFADLGVRKLRLTGGEPLLRRDLEKLVAMLAGIVGIQDIALTTNGALLAGKAQALAAAGPRRPVAPASPGEAASRSRYLDGAGEIGVIASVTKPFCRNCTRARLSADGKLYTCLFAGAGHDLRGPLRAGSSDQALREQISSIWARRADRYSEQRTRQAGRTQQVNPKGEMSRIGG